MRKRKPAGAPPAHELVLQELIRAGRPISAYEVLDRVRPAGITTPPTVYRALSRLINEGLAHRVESLNAFVSCARSGHGAAAEDPHRDRAAFAICEQCGSTEEFADGAAFAALDRWAAEHGFVIRRSMIEVTGRCAACRLVAGAATPPPPS
jgi:Fur family zinc uptake transcriptional regulator